MATLQFRSMVPSGNGCGAQRGGPDRLVEHLAIEGHRALLRALQRGDDRPRTRHLGLYDSAREHAQSKTAPASRALYRLWLTMQDELAALSSDHVHVVALRSDHWIQIRHFTRGNTEIDGQPDVVVRAVRAVVRAARDRARLPPCRRLFAGAGVRCRG